MLGVKAGSWASNRGQREVQRRRARHARASRSRASASRCAAASARSSRRASAWSAASTPTTTAPTCKDLGSLCSGSDRRARPARCARPSLDGRRPGRADRAGARTRRAARPQAAASVWITEAGRALVRAGQRRPHRRAAREEALRAGRDGAPAGAHAVPRGDRAGRGRARGRDRRRSVVDVCAATIRPSKLKIEPDLGPERLRQRARAARPRSARRRGIRSSPGAGRSRSRGAQSFWYDRHATTRRRPRWSTSPSRRSSSASPRSRSASPRTSCRSASRADKAAVPDPRRRRSPRCRVTQGGKPLAGAEIGVRRGRRGPARAAATTHRGICSSAMMQRARLGRRDEHRAERDHRPAPLRPQGGRGRRRRRPRRRRASCSTRCSSGSRSVVARRQRRSDDRGAAQRFADELQAGRDRRRRACRQFGTGSASIRVTQDLQVLAGLPPLVRERRPLRARC